MTDPIRAAGGIPLRRRGASIEVLLIHRRRYGDWTFPKGKLDPGETDAECALREVEEETGLACVLGPELPATAYLTGDRQKVVRYWLLRVVGGVLLAREGEIDEARWVTAAEAETLLTYAHDRPVLQAAVAAARG